MITVIHAKERGIGCSYVKFDGVNFGFSGRAAYASGLDKPNSPVPAIRYGYAIGYYGRTERNLVEAQYNDPHKDHWFMFELETQRIVGSSCPCCQG